jgi:hypothetical protein
MGNHYHYRGNGIRVREVNLKMADYAFAHFEGRIAEPAHVHSSQASALTFLGFRIQPERCSNS